MTRRGTLAYYLAAWVIGCFIFSVLLWIGAARSGAPAGASTLLATYFLALIFGAVDMLFFAFLLRRVMRWWGTHNISRWVVAGAGLAFLLMQLLTFAYERIPTAGALSQGAWAVLVALIVGVDLVRDSGSWEVPVHGAITAVVLCLVDRAFNQPADAAEAKQPAA
jgi:hypothetical protein